MDIRELVESEAEYEHMGVVQSDTIDIVPVGRRNIRIYWTAIVGVDKDGNVCEARQVRQYLELSKSSICLDAGE